MKNIIKASFLALIISTSFAACKGNGGAGTDTVKTDSMSKMTTDTIKKDTSAMPDSLKKDTILKTTTTKSSSKTSVTKKP